MTKQEYKAVQSAQRSAEDRDIKLIHLLINYRSHTGDRYPKGYIGANGYRKAEIISAFASGYHSDRTAKMGN